MATRRRSSIQASNPSSIMATRRRSSIEASNPSTDSPPANPSPDSPPANPSPESPPTYSDSFFRKRTRVGETVDFNTDPSSQEIAEYTLMGGNLAAIDAYAQKWSRNGQSFDSYELMLKRIFGYYRNFLAQRNRARFEEENGDEGGDEGESSRRSNRQ